MIKFYIYLSIIVGVLSAAFEIKGEEAGRPKFTVVLDAGHGGKDIGANDNGAMEKTINLGVALELESLLKKKNKDIKVVMTRSGDSYLTLQERADIANSAKGDLFISIHTNSVDKKNKNRTKISGSSVYALGLHKDENNMNVARRENSVIELESDFEKKYSGFDPSRDESYIIFEMAQKKNLSKSIKFADSVQKNLVSSGRSDRGVHQAGFWVLWATSMPAVLIELDFICNPSSATYLSSHKGQKELAEAIYKSITDYFSSSWDKPVTNSKSIANGKNKDSKPGISMISEETRTSDNNDKENYNAPQKIITSKKVVTTRKDKAPDRSVAQTGAGVMRRRRSEEARNISASQDFETSNIPLHSAIERIGRVSEEVETERDSKADEKPTKETKKKGKKSKKEKSSKDAEKTFAKENSKKRNGNKVEGGPYNAKIDKFVTIYKIQILASTEMLTQDNPRFCGLKPITVIKENNLYKYYYAEKTDKAEIEEMLKEVRKKIPDAFIISTYKKKSNVK